MKVVLLIGRSTGGIGTHAVDLAAGLRALGEHVELVTDPLTAARFGIPDARTWWPGRAAGLVGSARNLLRLRHLVRGADVVHAHGHQAGLVAVVAAVGTGTPVVVSQHNAVLGAGGVRGAVSAVVQRVVARRAAMVTGASSDLVDVARDHGARDARLAPVPSPRVPALLAATPLADDERRVAATRLLAGVGVAPTGPLVVTISRIAPQKALDVLVDAAARLTVPATWVVLGDGDPDLLVRLRRRVDEDGLPVSFVGAVPDPSPWLSAADAFVLTSQWEARALVVQEAMAAGTPVVATDTGGLHDLVEGVGTLVPVGDSKALARALARYLGEPAARHTASSAGRERATSWDDGDATARRWVDWYAGLLRMT